MTLITNIYWYEPDFNEIPLPTSEYVPDEIVAKGEDAISDYLTKLTGFTCGQFTIGDEEIE